MNFLEVSRTPNNFEIIIIFKDGGMRTAQPSKKGYLKIYYSFFENKAKWVKISSHGLCIYSDESEKSLLSCFSLAVANLKISSINTSIFEIICDIGKDRLKVIHFTAKSENERNEWCAFISRTLELIS